MIWNKFINNQRPIILSVGKQQLKQDMRYRVKVVNLNNQHSKRTVVDPIEKSTQLENKPNKSHTNSNEYSSNNAYPLTPIHLAYLKSSSNYLVQNWQFEIRKLTYEDAGTYQCLLPLINPLSKNITLQVIRKISIFY